MNTDCPNRRYCTSTWYCLNVSYSPDLSDGCHAPYLCSVLLSSSGPDGPELYMIDPSGVSWVRSLENHSIFI